MKVKKTPKKSLSSLKKEVEETLINIKQISKEDQRLLALWAADCAEHVLPYFEKECPKDDRPRIAIKAARKWARTGVFKMSDIRKASLDSHASARKAKEDSAARFAARAAGQAVATAHVAGHALGAAMYALKAAEAVGAVGAREWQYRRLPKHLRLASK